jgi:hypothetical protein
MKRCGKRNLENPWISSNKSHPNARLSYSTLDETKKSCRRIRRTALGKIYSTFKEHFWERRLVSKAPIDFSRPPTHTHKRHVDFDFDINKHQQRKRFPKLIEACCGSTSWTNKRAAGLAVPPCWLTHVPPRSENRWIKKIIRFIYPPLLLMNYSEIKINKLLN